MFGMRVARALVWCDPGNSPCALLLYFQAIIGMWKYWLDNHAQHTPTTEEDPPRDPEKEKLKDAEDF